MEPGLRYENVNETFADHCTSEIFIFHLRYEFFSGNRDCKCNININAFQAKKITVRFYRNRSELLSRWRRKSGTFPLRCVGPTNKGGWNGRVPVNFVCSRFVLPPIRARSNALETEEGRSARWGSHSASAYVERQVHPDVTASCILHSVRAICYTRANIREARLANRSCCGALCGRAAGIMAVS